MTENVAFFLPHFGHGGAEGVVLKLLQGIDRTSYAPVLILQRGRGEFLERIPDNVKVVILKHPRLPGCVIELARLFRREDIALVVTLTNAASLYSVLAARLARSSVATLVTEHTPLSGFLAEAKAPVLRKAAVKRIYPHATLTGGPIEDIGDEFKELLDDAAPPYVVLPNPVVDEVGAFRSPPAVAHHIVSVGRLAPEKRFDLLIDAFDILVRDTPDLRLTIFGEGSERPALEAQIARLELTGSVALPGFTSDLNTVHRSADLFVCTSRREGLGNAIIEAMARGVPVVSVDCPFGPKRLLRDGASGHLVRQDTPEAIAEAMRLVLADRALRCRYATAGQEIAQNYETKNAVAAYQAAFRRAIDIRAGTAEP
ncbi:glycosyltransferase [Marivita sp. S2033]|uniref:glycosyltransferase n=1 Tax=Marivita sp. S2033 TaxID=3373187 RepID=UPI003982BEFC